MDYIFAKTAKGQAEMSARSGDLSPRIRRLLILVDGKRNIEELQALVRAEDIRITLGRLEEEGYIALIDGAPTATAPAPAAPTPPAAPRTSDNSTFAPQPSPADPKRLRQARSLMTEAIHNFVGATGNSRLLQRIAQAASLDELRSIYTDWFALISGSLESPWEATDLRDKLLRII